MTKENKIWIYPFTLMIALVFVTNSCKKDSLSSDVIDIDGNVYKNITIGTQTWMIENLKTTHYNDGTAIPNITTSWETLATPAFCTYNNTTNADTIMTYGRLYNWYAVNTGKLAPVGWHVATNDEWTTLTNYLGSDYFNWGSKLKEAGTVHWQSPNTGATNETGFTALPGGVVWAGNFAGIGYMGSWWSSTENNKDDALHRALQSNSPNVFGTVEGKRAGLSVRCIKD